MSVFRKVVSTAKGVARLAEWRQWSRTVSIPGLEGNAEIVYDAYGIPFIEAATEEDLYAAQGFACASDRLWQLMFLKFLAAGRLSELLGDRPLEWRDLSSHFRDKRVSDLDHFSRCLGIARAAGRSLGATSGVARKALAAYVRGVNASIADQRRRGLPPEFLLLGVEPEEWTEVDSLGVLKLMAFQLDYSWRNILMLDSLTKALSPDKARAMTPAYPKQPSIVREPAGSDADGPGSRDEDDAIAQKGGSVAGGILALDAALRDASGLGGPHQGSNSWVVSGALTESGLPLLCNDPHLPANIPGPWFSVRLRGASVDVTGVALPGLPGVLIGHNRHVAWGITLACADADDIYIEKVDAEHPNRYRVGDHWDEMSVREEEILVKGGSVVRRAVRATRHGPVLSDVVSGANAEGEVYAFKWAAHEATHELDGLLAASRATNGDEFVALMRTGSGAPALNVSWADTGGNIGYALVGLIPIRRGWKGTLPVPGWDNSREWEGFVPDDQLPTTKNPREGFIVTANARVADEHYPYYISDFFEPPHRHMRIEERLTERAKEHKLTIDDMVDLQKDTVSLWARGLLTSVVAPWIKEARPVDTELLWAARELETWDGNVTSKSRAAAIFYPFIRHVVYLLLHDDLRDDLINLFLESGNTPVLPLTELLSDRRLPFWRGKDRNLIFHRALIETMNELRNHLGRDKARWTWGRLHKLWLRHHLHAVRPLRKIFSVGPFEGFGDGMTVNCGYMSHAYGYGMVLCSSFRYVATLGDWSKSKFVTLAGQSGRPHSRHYRDQTALWRRHEYRELMFDTKPKGPRVKLHRETKGISG